MIIIGVLLVLFPKKYDDVIELNAQKYSLEKSLVASVVNIESSYKKDAVSSVGAIGLMQILPSTARDIAGRLGLEYREDMLLEVETNIQMGCYYLAYLIEMFDGNVINALCAYNWGLQNVKNWLEIGNIDKDGTIINIPIDETKNYIKKYKTNVFVYKNLYGF
jgi:soluble lytic murein transglycosylase